MNDERISNEELYIELRKVNRRLLAAFGLALWGILAVLIAFQIPTLVFPLAAMLFVAIVFVAILVAYIKTGSDQLAKILELARIPDDLVKSEPALEEELGEGYE